jgi:hypothetical protein
MSIDPLHQPAPSRLPDVPWASDSDVIRPVPIKTIEQQILGRDDRMEHQSRGV